MWPIISSPTSLGTLYPQIPYLQNPLNKKHITYVFEIDFNR